MGLNDRRGAVWSFVSLPRNASPRRREEKRKAREDVAAMGSIPRTLRTQHQLRIVFFPFLFFVFLISMQRVHIQVRQSTGFASIDIVASPIRVRVTERRRSTKIHSPVAAGTLTSQNEIGISNKDLFFLFLSFPTEAVTMSPIRM